MNAGPVGLSRTDAPPDAETSRQAGAKAHDTGRYYRVPADNRDLNYNKYFVEGEMRISEFDDYSSHNTVQLDVEKMKGLLLELDYIKAELSA